MIRPKIFRRSEKQVPAFKRVHRIEEEDQRRAEYMVNYEEDKIIFHCESYLTLHNQNYLKENDGTKHQVREHTYNKIFVIDNPEDEEQLLGYFKKVILKNESYHELALKNLMSVVDSLNRSLAEYAKNYNVRQRVYIKFYWHSWKENVMN